MLCVHRWEHPGGPKSCSGEGLTRTRARYPLPWALASHRAPPGGGGALFRAHHPTTPPPRPPARAPARRGSQATSEGFELLFAYISGANARNESIAMTAPVWTAIGPGAGPFCSSTFRVGFSVPASLQAAAPEPSDARVSLTPTGEAFSCVAVRGFGGHNEVLIPVAKEACAKAQAQARAQAEQR